jgi:hypothetical protein
MHSIFVGQVLERDDMPGHISHVQDVALHDIDFQEHLEKRRDLAAAGGRGLSRSAISDIPVRELAKSAATWVPIGDSTKDDNSCRRDSWQKAD